MIGCLTETTACVLVKSLIVYLYDNENTQKIVTILLPLKVDDFINIGKTRNHFP